SLALEEAAGDLPGRVHALFDVDGEREEVRALARLHLALRGREHHRVARSHEHGSVRLLGELAGFESQLLVADGHGDRRGQGLSRYCHCVPPLLKESGGLSQPSRVARSNLHSPPGWCRFGRSYLLRPSSWIRPR